jgi:hypothetical protein
MSKTPVIRLVLGLLMLVAGPLSANSTVGQPSRPAVAGGSISDFNGSATGGEAERPALDFNQAGSKATDLPLDAVSGDAVSGQATAPLPLSQVAGGAEATSGPGRPSLWDLINQVRYGGLPEPASWALMLIGFGMIGGVLRGFMIANRRLAGLQPENVDAADDDG